MNLGIESETLEFKKTTGEVDKAMDNIASMLNKHGHGTLYFGVSPNGEVTGQQISASSLDDVAKRIKDAIKPMIYPEIKKERLDNRDVIRVDFSGKEKPYSSFGRYYKRVFADRPVRPALQRRHQCGQLVADRTSGTVRSR